MRAQHSFPSVAQMIDCGRPHSAVHSSARLYSRPAWFRECMRLCTCAYRTCGPTNDASPSRMAHRNEHTGDTLAAPAGPQTVALYAGSSSLCPRTLFEQCARMLPVIDIAIVVAVGETG